MPDPSIRKDQRIIELAQLFKQIGADDPLSWAQSEIEEDIPQLARFVFLRAAWQRVISEDDTNWIDHAIENSVRHPTSPGAGIGPALKNLLNLGASRQDLTELVRVIQFELLFALCNLLDNPGELEPELGDLGWELHEIDQYGHPTQRLVQGLYESVLSMDPTGREMRPRS